MKASLVAVLPRPAPHDIVNTETAPLGIYPVCTPPNHLDRRLYAANVDAEEHNADQAFGAAVR